MVAVASHRRAAVLGSRRCRPSGYGSFEWDAAKARANFRKHRVTFEEAATVFLDDLAVSYEDPTYADRLILIGMSLQANMLLVVFAERGGGEIIRIISAPGDAARTEGL
jgi:uncharacterized protein